MTYQNPKERKKRMVVLDGSVKYLSYKLTYISCEGMRVRDMAQKQKDLEKTRHLDL